jgi:phosphoglucomutase
LAAGLYEVPAGFKWFTGGLLARSLGFCGEESAGATFLRADGGVWTTDKDGIALALLSAEITARMGRDPGEIYRGLVRDFGDPAYERIDAPATAEQKRSSRSSRRNTFDASTWPASRRRTCSATRQGNGAPIGGVKVIAENAWFAARPSGTENIYKIYAESYFAARSICAVSSSRRRRSSTMRSRRHEHRTGLLWELMRQCPYTAAGLQRAGFTGGWL